MQAALINQSHKIAWALLLALPTILPFIRRAGPVVLVLAACLTLVPIILRGQLRDLMWRMVTPTTMLIAAFLGWAFITLLWTPVPARGFHSVASATLMALSGLVLVHGLERLDPSTIVRWLATSIAIGASIVAVDLVSGGYLLKLIHSRPEPYRYNMVLVSLVVLSSALLIAPWRDHLGQRAVAFLALLVALTIGESESAKLGALVLFLTAVATIISPPSLLRVASTVIVLGIWLAFPLLPDLAAQLMQLAPGFAESSHAVERLSIWSAFTQMALAGLPWGWGVEAVSAAPQTSFFLSFPDLRAGLDWMHPHNNVLQIAVETGGVGLFLALCMTFLALQWSFTASLIARISFLACVFAVGLVSHGFWQAWWWSLVIVGFIFLTKVKRRDCHLGIVSQS